MYTSIQRSPAHPISIILTEPFARVYQTTSNAAMAIISMEILALLTDLIEYPAVLIKPSGMEEFAFKEPRSVLISMSWIPATVLVS